LNLPAGAGSLTSVQPELFQPLAELPALAQLGRRARMLLVVGRLDRQVSVRLAQTGLDSVGAQLRQDYPEIGNRAYRIAPLKGEIVSSAQTIVLLFFGAVGFVLLIAVTNVANLVVTRAVNREREIALRLAIGSTASRLARMLLTESILLSVAGGLAGIIVAQIAVRLLVLYLPSEFPRVENIAIDLRVLMFTAAVTAAAGIAFGLVPVLAASKKDLDRRLRESSRTYTEAGRHMFFRKLLVAGEVALSIVLLAGAGLVGKSFWRLLTQDLGMDAANVVNVAFLRDL
jgi:putative ABC transport system permease protein